MKRPLFDRLMRAPLAAFIGAAVVWSAPQGALAETTPHQDAQINRGEIVVNVKSQHPIYNLDVYGMIESEADPIWNAITTYDRYEEFLPLVIASSIRKREGNRAWQFLRMRPPWPFAEKWVVNLNVENRKAGHIDFGMTEGNVKYENGYWQLAAMPGQRTRLQYHLTIDPWLDVVPAWLVEFVTRQVMPSIIQGVRKRVKSHPAP